MTFVCLASLSGQKRQRPNPYKDPGRSLQDRLRLSHSRLNSRRHGKRFHAHTHAHGADPAGLQASHISQYRGAPVWLSNKFDRQGVKRLIALTRRRFLSYSPHNLERDVLRLPGLQRQNRKVIHTKLFRSIFVPQG